MIGSEYLARGNYVINRYTNGDNVGWYNDESQLKNITMDWDETSKIGSSDFQVSDLKLHEGKANFETDKII